MTEANSLVMEQRSMKEIDPFYLYLDLVDAFQQGEVFLLDAAQDAADKAYRMSMIGVLPVLEVQVKDADVHIVAPDGLLAYLEDALTHASYGQELPRTSRNIQSVVQGSVLTYVPQDPMDLLNQIRIAIQQLLPHDERRPAFSAGFLGYIGYDAVHYLETLPKTTVDDRDLPDVRLQWHAIMIHLQQEVVRIYDTTTALAAVINEEELNKLRADALGVRQVVEDHQRSGMTRHPLLTELPSIDLPQAEVQDDVSQAEFQDSVRKAKAYIEAGDIFQIVLSKRMHITNYLHPYLVYERLRHLNPSPYMFMAEYPDMRLFGASPEVQFRAIDGVAEMKPIAGTSKGRGKTPEEDAALAERLLHDEKERAEHVMLVDLCRNDLGRVSKIGSVHVPEFLVVEPYSHLFHLVSSVKSVLRDDVSVFHALLATFPAGTLSGAPKIRAMEIIDELERYRRGTYGGMLGMIDFDANANTAIVIRTVVEVGNQYYIQVGAGIVADSDPTQEWLECGHKAGAIVDVLAGRRGVSV